jgi:hypothetical protein
MSTDGKAAARMMTGFIRLTSISQNGREIILETSCGDAALCY